MSQLLVSESSEQTPRVTPHILPCRIHHDGAVGESEGYWETTEKGDKKIAHFRGRELHGIVLKVPEGYRGAVVEPRPAAPKAETAYGVEVIDLAEDDDDVPLGNLDVAATFEQVVVWDHEATADATDDVYVRGMEEWIGLAAKIHAYEDDAAPLEQAAKKA